MNPYPCRYIGVGTPPSLTIGPFSIMLGRMIVEVHDSSFLAIAGYITNADEGLWQSLSSDNMYSYVIEECVLGTLAQNAIQPFGYDRSTGNIQGKTLRHITYSLAKRIV